MSVLSLLNFSSDKHVYCSVQAGRGKRPSTKTGLGTDRPLPRAALQQHRASAVHLFHC